MTAYNPKKRTLKRVITFAVIAALVISLTVPVLALPLSDGIEALRGQWSRGLGPVVEGRDIDYSYYSPVDHGADASKKYPLIIFLAGALEGQYEGKELDANEVAKLTSDEYQALFSNGGAYILIPRAPEEEDYYWDQSMLTPSLFAALKDFVDKTPNIDKSKIFCAGWCLGGTGALNLTVAHPEYFAGSIIMCPSRSITHNEARILENSNVWLISCIADSYSNFLLNNHRSWLLLNSTSKNKDNIRLTTYWDVPDTELVPGVPFIENHNVWDNLIDDHTDPNDTCSGIKTVDGNGKEVKDIRLTTLVNNVSAENRPSTYKPNPLFMFLEKLYLNFNEHFKADLRLRIFDILTVIYEAMGWI